MIKRIVVILGISFIMYDLDQTYCVVYSFVLCTLICVLMVQVNSDLKIELFFVRFMSTKSGFVGIIFNTCALEI